MLSLMLHNRLRLVVWQQGLCKVNFLCETIRLATGTLLCFPWGSLRQRRDDDRSQQQCFSFFDPTWIWRGQADETVNILAAPSRRYFIFLSRRWCFFYVLHAVAPASRLRVDKTNSSFSNSWNWLLVATVPLISFLDYFSTALRCHE
jgi:hypothetical protein